MNTVHDKNQGEDFFIIKMDKCQDCSQSAVMVCSCKYVSLCLNCIEAHQQAAPDDTHFYTPTANQKPRQNKCQNAISMLQRIESLDQQISSESEHF